MSDDRLEPYGECPLCLDAFELDDQSFYPCPCEYQICRFCWHRIKSDENGLCPACRQPYSDLPAQFQPLSKEQLTNMRIDKKNKASERKAKLAESRKHLAAVRVVQKCLVFVVGLSSRMADSDLIKRPEYFGRFGKIHKCVINNNTNYAGSTGHSASAYITFYKTDDALRAVQQTNNTQVDGRTLKASLGTTKYCSQFMKALTCNKQDCMYLHDLGDERASFTKEDMQQGKHQEYEQELHDEFYKREAEANVDIHLDRYKTVFTLRSEANGHLSNPLKVDADSTTTHTTNGPLVNGSVSSNRTTPSPSNAWGDANNHSSSSHSPADNVSKTKTAPSTDILTSITSSSISSGGGSTATSRSSSQGFSIFSTNLESALDCRVPPPQVSSDSRSDPFQRSNSVNAPWETAVFSGETYGDPARRFLSEPGSASQSDKNQPYQNGIPHLLNILENDDLEFDPIEECQKGLEELMQKERLLNCVSLSESFPPSSGNFGQPNHDHLSHSFNGFHHANSQSLEAAATTASSSHVDQQQSQFDRREWQANLRALLPNVNIQFQSAFTNGLPAAHSHQQNHLQPPGPSLSGGVPTTTWQSNSAGWNSNATGQQYNIGSDDPAIISTRKSHINHLGAFWENNNYQTHAPSSGQTQHHISLNSNSAVDSKTQVVANAFGNNSSSASLKILPLPSQAGGVGSSNRSSSQLFTHWKQTNNNNNHTHSSVPNKGISSSVETMAPSPSDHMAPPGFKASELN